MNGEVRVLHVDDDRKFTELTVAYLERAGVETEFVTTVESALDRLSSEPFDCVVSDYDMPGENGLALLDRVREAHPEMPFILFTGKGSEEVASEAISKGVTDYLQKGGGSETYDLLVKRIENAVEQRRARADAERSRRFLEKVVEHATDIIATVDASGQIVFISGSVEEILGYTPDELRELGPFELIHPDDRETVERRFEERMADPDRPTGIRHRAMHADGSVVELEARAYNLMEDSDVEGIIIYTRPSNVTDSVEE
ncbi:PAS domain-containing response regulator [Salinigranum salinum]|uniref:PAS domain-containing response regulator n=1 Tax=Salinigranum salinum TaxID=1364937 RepID=UPI001260E594|nr:response regulator [Salinigranum salinum]